MRSHVALLLALGASSALAGGSAHAAPKKVPAAGKAAPACGAKVLPLVVGNQWTYNTIPAPVAAIEQIKKLAPPQPKQIVVTVTAIDTKGPDTVVTLEEKLGYDLGTDAKTPKIVEHTVTTTITCNTKGKFDIAPDSFFFAGEPGGYHGLVLDQVTRKKETSLKLVRGAIGENEWIEEIAATFKREPAKGSDAKLVGGKIEIERKFTPQPKEIVNSKMGSYDAEKLGLITSGRVTLETRNAPNGKPCTVLKGEVNEPSEACELPANWISTIWLADNVGVVQTLNMYAHMYQLVDAQLK